MSNTLKTLILLAFSGVAVMPATAQLITTAVPFLRIEPDSRIAGMGNAGVAVSDNAAAIFWNPASLGFQTEREINLTHANWLPQFNAGLFYEYLVATIPLEGIGTLGANVSFLNLGQQEYTDEGGNSLGTFTSYDIAVGTAIGIPVTKRFSFGIGGRFIYSNLAPGITVSGQETRAGRSIGFDLAGLYRSDPFRIANRAMRLRFGFNLNNLGPGITYTDQAQKDPLPTMLRTGFALTTNIDADGYNTLTLGTDISKLMAKRDTTGKSAPLLQALTQTWGSYTYFNGQENVTLSLPQQFLYGFGAEYWYNKQFALRGGYFYEHPNNGNRQYFTLGAGLRYNRFGIDYSYVIAKENSPLANHMRFSILAKI
jgi:long-subunit fatty acid transport protein